MTQENGRPVCPYCEEVMVKGHIEMEDGEWQEYWLCGCVGKDEHTSRVDASDEEVPDADSDLGG